MESSSEEAQRLIATSGRTQIEVAEALTRHLGRTLKHYTISRISSGERAPKADELDGLRTLYGQSADLQPPVSRVPRLTESPEMIPLYAATGGPRGNLRLGEDNIVGVTPIHPAQRGASEPFSFIVPDNRLANRLCRGETAHALRNRPPFPGQMCLVELSGGDAAAYIYDREDERTLFVRVLKPKEAPVSIPLVQVKAVHVIVAVTFGPN